MQANAHMPFFIVVDVDGRNVANVIGFQNQAVIKGVVLANPLCLGDLRGFAYGHAALDLERAKAVPDPSVGGGVRYFSDANDAAGVASISWPLPLLDDNRSAVLSARLKLAQTRAMQEQARTQVSTDLTRAYARLQAAAFSIQSLNDKALPAADSAYKAALESYNAGQSDYLTALDAQRSLLDIQNQQLDAELEYHQSLIEIEKITAHALSDSNGGE